MAKIRSFTYEHSEHTQYLYNCPGCGYKHAFGLKPKGNHNWNGDFDKPTVSPSLLQNWTPGKTCHSFIREGMIEFLADCNHHLAGKTVELPEYIKTDHQP